MLRSAICAFFALTGSLAVPSVGSADGLAVSVHYLRQFVPPPPTLSNLDPVPEDLGVAGGQLAKSDNLTTGQFLGQDWNVAFTTVPDGGDFVAAARAALAETDLVIVDAPANQLLQLADLPEAREALILNAGSDTPALRAKDCRANVLHTAVSLPMRSDALMQFLTKKRWTKIAMIEGQQPNDMALANAIDTSARKFGLKIKWRKTWSFDADMRRNAADEVPLFTQDMAKADVILVADAANDFARYIPYNTWAPQPVIGSDGLIASAWAPVVEQWGAAQLQSRFKDSADRAMRPKDYAAWAALRTIGEAVTRTGAADAKTLRRYILSDDFELAGFLGRPLTFRQWNGQMRQPIPLTHASAMVARAPLEGFLHPRTELDTLGLDAPESGCTAFEG